jgi:hypothetical protein
VADTFNPVHRVPLHSDIPIGIERPGLTLIFSTFLRGTLLCALASALPAAHADPRADLAKSTCGVLDHAVTTQSGGPLLLASYQPSNDKPVDVEALRNVAFTYDNALASIALFACGKPASARRIADALVLATTNDPDYHDGRVRNAYAAGVAKGPTMTLPGYWSVERKAWNQDPYQVSFATGNGAWAALALLAAYRQSHQTPYLVAARRVLDWTQRNTLGRKPPIGFVGGYFVEAGTVVRQDWKSVEQNVDLVAAWTGLDRAAPDADARVQAAIARAFVNSQWDPTEGRFLIGTGPDGQTSDHDHSGLDAQIWPLIAVPKPPADWMRVLTFVDAAHAVAGGYGFNRGPDGIWTEGTAQVAAVFVLRGLPKRALPLWPLLGQQQTAQGWLFATPRPRINTRLAIGPDSVTNDFFYYHLPHLGATAWAALAATGVNPFTGR